MNNIYFIVAVAALVLGVQYSLKANGDGEVLFVQYFCNACHACDKPAGDLTESLGDRDFIRKYIKNPLSVNSQSVMPVFNGADCELEALVDYVMMLSADARGDDDEDF